MRDRERKRLEAIAYHEAGHAVAAFTQGVRFARVSIVPDESAETLGYVLHTAHRWITEDETYTPSPVIRARIEARIIVVLAGQNAEFRFTGRHNPRHAQSDYTGAFDLAMLVVRSEREFDAYFKWMAVRTSMLFDSPWNWAAVEALAATLMDKRSIGSTTARAIIRGVLQSQLGTMTKGKDGRLRVGPPPSASRPGDVAAL